MESTYAFDPLHDDCLSNHIDNIVRLVAWRAEQQPRDTAYVFLDRGEEIVDRLTYSELQKKVDDLAGRLCRMELSGSPVLLMYPQSIDYLVAMLACFRAKCLAVSAYPPSRNYARTLKKIVEDAGPRALLSRSDVYARSVENVGIQALSELQQVFSDQLSTVEQPSEGGELDWPKIEANTLALLQYTSGSTSSPKGVKVQHGNLMANLAALQAAFQHPRPSNIVSWLPLYHDMGLVSKAFFGLYRGCTVVLMSPLSFFQKPVRWLRAISTFRAHSSGGPNFAFDRCVQAISSEEMAGLDLRCWKHAYNGAEPIRADTLSRFAAKFRDIGFEASSLYPCYGMAEACVFISGGTPQGGAKTAKFDRVALGQGRAERIIFAKSNECEFDAENRQAKPDQDKSSSIELVSCGHVWRDEKLHIVDPESRKPLRDQKIGEIWVGGPSVCQGYWGDPKSHREAFGQSLEEESSCKFLRTGDLGFIEDGELYIAGRIKDMLIVHGQNYYPQDIEGVVTDAIEQLRPAGTVAFATSTNGEESLIVISEVAREAIHHDFGQICDSVQRVIASDIGLKPAQVVLIKPGKLPRTSSGKLQRLRCRQLWQENTLSPLYRWRAESTRRTRETVSSSSSSELQIFKVAVLEALRQGAAEKLSLDSTKINSDANLIRLGLHSIQLVELSHQIQQLFGRPVEVADIFEDTSLEQVASAICSRWIGDSNRLKSAGEESAPKALAHREIGPLSKVESADLSFGQRAVWAVHCRDPNSIIYNIHLSLTISSQINEGLLQESIREIIGRHGALRTKFVQKDGIARQVIDSKAEVDFLRAEGGTWSMTQEEAWVESCTRRPFDLESDYPIRIRLLSKGPSQHRLLFVIHHICFDFWSLVIFANELGKIYQAKLQGVQPQLSPLPTSYAAFVAWQQAYLSENQERHWSFWRQYLEGTLPQLRLPYDKPEVTGKSFSGGIVNVALGLEQSQYLAELGRKHGATAYVTTLAIFSELLRRLCRQEDMIVGTPTAGRPDARFDGLLGYFVNPVAIRLQPSATRSFANLLEHVRSNVQQVLRHQSFPFSTIVERLNPPRSANRWPIYQVAFTFQNVQIDSECDWGALSIGWPQENMKWGGLSVGSAQIEERVENFDLKLVMCNHQGRYLASFQYDSERFEKSTIQALADSWLELVEGIVKYPGQSLESVSSHHGSTSEGDRSALQHLLTSPSNPDLGRSEEKSIDQHFQEVAGKQAERPAIVEHGRIWSYRQLEQRSFELSRILSKGRTEEVESVVAVLLPRGAAFVVSMLAVWRSGSVLLPLDAELPDERVRWILADAKVQTLVTSGENLRVFSDCCACVDVEQEPLKTEPQAYFGHERSERHSLQRIAYIIYTSGSTGRPKGVEVSHAALMNLVRWHVETYEISTRDKSTQIASMGFDACVWELCPYLFAGAQLFVVPEEMRGDSYGLAKWLREQQITITFLPTPLAESLLQEDWSVAPHLRKILVGGDRLHVVKKPHGLEHLKIFNHYGPTEATVVSTAGEVVHNGQFPHIGRGISNVELYVLNDALEVLRDGAVGELCIAGANLGRAYHRRPGQTAERFIPNPFSAIPGSRCYRSGDLVRRRPDGNIEFIGRVDEQTKIRGNRIEPREVEQWLAQIPGVQQSTVVVRSNERNENQLAAYVVLATEEHDADQHVEEQHVDYWSTLYDQTYADNQKPPSHFDITGWKSSYSGEDIAADDMALWLEDTTEQILNLRPENLFEIGCGTGLLLFGLAPSLSCYEGIDISKVAVERIRHQIEQRGWKHVYVETRVAHQLDYKGLDRGFDTFVLNSVVQYFPSWNYLTTVLRQIVANVDVGQIWIGDIRDFDLLRAFHTDVQLEKCPEWLSAIDLRKRVDRSIQNDHELCIGMDAMRSLAASQPKVSGIEVRIHRGNGHRELSCFRYHVVLHIGASKRFFVPQWQPWVEEDFFSRLENYLRNESPAQLCIKGIVNGRMQQVLDRLTKVGQALEEQTVATIRQQCERLEAVGVDPEGLWKLGDRLGYRVDLLRRQDDGAKYFSAVFRRWGHECVNLAIDTRQNLRSDQQGIRENTDVMSVNPRDHANLPTRHLLATRRIDELKHELAKVVPRYMVPDQWMEVEQLPMTRNGKVDRSALPPMHRTRQFFVAPRNRLERMIATIWTQLLGSGTVGIHDNFFELGGDSILSIQMVSRAKDQGFSLQARDVFSHQTVEELARFVEQHQKNIVAEKAHQQASECKNRTESGHRWSPCESLENESWSTPDSAQMARGQGLGSSSAIQSVELSPLQHGMLIESLAVADQTTYVEQIRFRLKGRIDLDALRKAWTDLQKRYSALRSAFDVEDSIPKRRVWPSEQLELPFAILDWSHLGGVQVETDFARWMERERSKGFDFSVAPMMRVHVVLRSNLWVDMVWTHHHLILDGWSVSLLVSELFDRYREICGKSLSYRELEGDPGEFARWCKQRDEVEEQTFWKSYWGKEASCPELVEHGYYPAKTGGSKRASSENECFRFKFSPELTRRIGQFSRAEKLPIQSILQASFAWLLRHYQNSSFAQFGMVVSGRNADVHRVSEVVGLLINTVPMRVRVPFEMSVVNWIKDLNARTQSVLEHSFCSLPKIQQWLTVDRTKPLFSVLFSIENYPLGQWGEQSYAGLEVSEIHYTGHTHYPLTVVVIPGDTIQLRVGYSSVKFGRRWIATFCDNFQRVCEHLLSHAEKCLSQLDAKGLFSTCSNANSGAAPAVIRATEVESSSLVERFHEVLSQFSQRIALVDSDQCRRNWSYEELNANANRLCNYLDKQGVKHGDRVALGLEPSFELIACILGVLKRGAVYVPIDPELPRARIDYMLDDAQVGLLIAAESNRAFCENREQKFVSVEGIFDSSNPSGHSPASQSVEASDIAYIIYTSGSTGNPKGVAISHHQVSRLLDACRRRLSWSELDTWALLHSPSFDFSVWEIWGALLSGARLLIVSKWEKLDPRLCWQAIVDHRVSILNCTPSAFYPLSEEALQSQSLPSRDGSREKEPLTSPSALRYIIFGGEKLRPSQLQKWQQTFALSKPELINMYGITETTVHVTSHVLTPKDIENGEAVVGQPLDDLRVYIVGRRRELLPRGVLGEIFVGGAGIGLGYVGKAGETSARFLPDGWSGEAGGRVYRSGDLGYWNESGDLVVVGRADDQVKLRGFRVELGEVEGQLLKAPGVQQCAVGVEEDSGTVKGLVGYVVADDEGKTNETDWEAWLESRLPSYMVPRRWIRMRALPLTSNGKLDRESLPRFERGLEGQEADERPQGREETKLAEIWREVLLGGEGLDTSEKPAGVEIGRHQNFFELGGDSIQAMQIINRARTIGLEITAQDLFEGQSIAAVLARVKSRGEHCSTSNEGAEEMSVVGDLQPPIGSIELTPIQQWFFEQDLVCPNHFNQALLLTVKAGTWTEDRLRWSLEALCREHTSLRMRYRPAELVQHPSLDSRTVHLPCGELPSVEEDESENWPLCWEDLSHLSASEQQTAMEKRNAWAQSHLDLKKGPLCRAVYFRLGNCTEQEGRDRLLLVVHHLVVDGVSWRILLDDLQTFRDHLWATHAEHRSSTSALLPETNGSHISVQAANQVFRNRGESEISYAQWAKILHAQVIAHESKEFEYWNNLSWSRVENLLPTFNGVENSIENRRVLIQNLGIEDTQSLLRAPQGAYKTQVSELLLAALAESFVYTRERWDRNAQVVRVDVEGHGREAFYGDYDLSQTVGWFTSIFPVLIELEPQSISERIVQTRDQFRGIPHRGVGFSALRYFASQKVRKQIRDWPSAQFSFNYLGRFPEEWGKSSGMFGGKHLEQEVTRLQQHPKNPCSYRIDINLSVVGTKLWIHWACSRGEDFNIVEKIAQVYVEQLKGFIAHCSADMTRNSTAAVASAPSAVSPNDGPDGGRGAGLSAGVIADVLERIED